MKETKIIIIKENIKEFLKKFNDNCVSRDEDFMKQVKLSNELFSKNKSC